LLSSPLSLATAAETEALLNRYFQHVQYRIRNHWAGLAKRMSRAIGVDIKYDQLRQIEPTGWSFEATPFLIGYLRSRDAIIVHTIRRNVIECAISVLIAQRRNLWHNYDHVAIDRSYRINPAECLYYARTIVEEQNRFLSNSERCRLVECTYEDLVMDIARTNGCGTIVEGPGPLREIATALQVSYDFRDEGHLRKAIDVPYSKLLSNYDEFRRELEKSEFAAMVAELGS
jgi:hypothetical protein